MVYINTIQTPKSDQSISTVTRSGRRGHSNLRPVTSQGIVRKGINTYLYFLGDGEVTRPSYD